MTFNQGSEFQYMCFIVVVQLLILFPHNGGYPFYVGLL